MMVGLEIMKKTTVSLLFSIFTFSTACAWSQEWAPVSSITGARWEDYRDMYDRSPLCAREEITLWTCATSKKVFSLCSSPVVNKTSGYIQYRASKNGKIVFVYPLAKSSPSGLFDYESAPSGDASISFMNAGYTYRLVDPLRSNSFISITAPEARGKETLINCDSNQTLQINYSMRLMYDSGIWKLE